MQLAEHKAQWLLSAMVGLRHVICELIFSVFSNDWNGSYSLSVALCNGLDIAKANQSMVYWLFTDQEYVQTKNSL